LASKAPEAKLVSCADKLHNLSNTLRDIQVEGFAAWNVRMAKSKNGQPGKQLWYFEGCLSALSTEWNAPILICFGEAVDQFRCLVQGKG